VNDRPGVVGAAIASAAHIAAYTTLLIVLFAMTALCVGKLGFIVAWLLAPAIAARLAALTNRTVARRVVRHAIVGVVANGGTIGVLRAFRMAFVWLRFCGAHHALARGAAIAPPHNKRMQLTGRGGLMWRAPQLIRGVLRPPNA
jgi:hypothetical protein